MQGTVLDGLTPVFQVDTRHLLPTHLPTRLYTHVHTDLPTHTIHTYTLHTRAQGSTYTHQTYTLTHVYTYLPKRSIHTYTPTYAQVCGAQVHAHTRLHSGACPCTRVHTCGASSSPTNHVAPAQQGILPTSPNHRPMLQHAHH